MEEWKEYKLGEITNMKNGKKRPQNNGVFPVYGGNGIMDYSDSYNAENAIIVGRVGAYCGCVYKCESKCWVSDNAISIFAKDIADTQFLYYLMTTLDFHHHHIGGAQPLMTQDIIGDFTVSIPPLAIQHQIIQILKSLDDKIEVNKRINDNLELQAQALYKSWFVDFEPFKDGKFVDSELGMIPEGWSIGDIGTYSKVRSGFAFKSSWWTQSGSKVIKIKNITSDYRLDMTECSFVSKDNTAKASEFRVEVGDLLIAMTGATIGKFCLITSSDNNTYVNQRVGKFFLGNEPLKRLPFLYCCLKQDSVINEIINKGQGSAQPNISGTDIESIKIVLPNDETIPIFNEHLYPMYKMIIKNQEEIELLSTMRDSILPKLMSGELKVNDLNN